MNEEREPGTGVTGSEETGPDVNGTRSEETVGEMLLAARERSGMTLEGISQETKIPVATLRYLETDNFEAVPAKVYARGFLRAYAVALGLDPRQLLGRYELQTGQTHRSRGDLWEIEEQTVEERLPRTRLLRLLLLPAVLLAVAVIILVKVLGGGEEARPPADMLDTVRIEETDSRPKGDAGPVGAEAAGSRQTDEAAAGDGAAREPAGEQAGKPAPDRAAARTTDAPPGAPEPPAEMELRLIATDRDRIYLDVVVYRRTADGLDSIPDEFILDPGGVKVLRSNDSFLLRTVGNAGGIRLELDGRELPALGERGRVIQNIRITRNGITGG